MSFLLSQPAHAMVSSTPLTAFKSQRIGVGGHEEAFLATVPGGKFFHGDVDHDGFVSNTDITPFIGLLTAAGSNATAVPEPGSVSLLIAGLVVSMTRGFTRRRAASFS